MFIIYTLSLDWLPGLYAITTNLQTHEQNTISKQTQTHDLITTFTHEQTSGWETR